MNDVMEVVVGLIVVAIVAALVFAPIVFVFANADKFDGMTSRERHRSWFSYTSK